MDPLVSGFESRCMVVVIVREGGGFVLKLWFCRVLENVSMRERRHDGISAIGSELLEFLLGLLSIEIPKC